MLAEAFGLDLDTATSLASLLGPLGAAGLQAYGQSNVADTLAGLSREQMAAQEARYRDLVARDQTRYETSLQRENEALARQRGDIEFGRSVGAPYRTRLADLSANPSMFLTSPEVTVPVQQGTDATARALSVHGNPYGNPTSLQGIQDYSANQLFGRLGEEKTRLGAFGGLASYNAGGASIPGIGTTVPATATAGANVGTTAGADLAAQSVKAGGDIYGALGYGLGSIFNPVKSLTQQIADLRAAGFPI